ncbi:hypothetical protein DH2020_026335 [Rehmannia glutinosa]|uniref:Cholesterol oxidase n=1 Tax=Rehmannia glutinosa TaxID=99300 RepID=A0ABR0VZ52_REHGL
MGKSVTVDFFDSGDDGGFDAIVIGSGYGGSVAACRMSMAGFKVCLLEKGHKWEAQDFPTDCFKMMSAVRVENRNLGVDLGPKDALFQVCIQDDALAATACGLGGGSLINAGLVLPTTVRARRDPKWPKAWEEDWDRCEALASDMLRAQSVPMKFQNSKIMEGVIGEEYDKSIDNPIKLSMNFDIEQVSDSRMSQETGSCLACGNCLAGCPYNAKNSTDKTYLVSAIQSAVIPTAYPSFLFKGITTYGWQSGYGFLYGITDWLKHVLGLNHGQDMVLNAIGHDDSSGKLTFEKDTNRILFQPPHDHLLPRKVKAFQKLAKKLGGVLFMPRFRSTSVHLLGGCIASSDVSSGVCNSDGQVFDQKSPTGVHPGLYICDASIIPCSVGINPCLTITTAAEHVSRRLVQDAIKKNIGNFVDMNFDKKPGSIHNGKMKRIFDSEVMTTEIMRGQVGGMPCTAYLKLKFQTSSVVDKTNNATGEKAHPLLRGKVGGYIECRAIEMDKMYIIHGEIDLCETDIRTPYTQYMHYRLLVAASSGSRWFIRVWFNVFASTLLN